MGASSSTEQNVPTERREVETEAASAGALPMLQKAFSNLANPETNSVPIEKLQQCLNLVYKGQSDAGNRPELFAVLLDHWGSSIVDQFFVPTKGSINWVEFVRGYNKCCARTSASMSLNILLRVFHSALGRANVPLKLEFESDDADCKINGSLLPSHVLLLLLMCWSMSWDCRSLKPSEGKVNLSPPDLNHLVLSAISSCANIDSGFNAWDSDITSLEVEIPAGKFFTWVLSTIPCLSDCLRQYFHARLQVLFTAGDESVPPNSSAGDVSFTTCDNNVLTHGRAWAIALTQRSSINEEILDVCFPSSKDGVDDRLLYRSSAHGRGLNRFWSCVEGYKGPLLILVAASSGDIHEGSSIDRKWILGALTNQGFENKDQFYGSSGCLYAINPVFHAFPLSGKEKNFVYSHLHPTGRVYEPHPKPVGIAFGGTMGNERIFIDEDFARVTVRHHAIDKTYHHGPLFPNQNMLASLDPYSRPYLVGKGFDCCFINNWSRDEDTMNSMKQGIFPSLYYDRVCNKKLMGFLPTEASISEVEVWGLGGNVAKKVQDSYKKREELFTEQRRKVDLKTFASWDDSPEKMMMDMMSNPNAVRREDR
ncbi:TLD domain-containing protein KIAA1609-like protein [Senna tora]|uniref:TLD domain-containing protein KIAA1609-like protein n=1 Tax=Senna tora TaxID=362788 RepID=A0A835CI82_9FABA|nr:TLD domain-containing protein KIAA1609-like protein [Senna tora]